MPSEELVKRLKKLSGQERKVLQLRCQALSDRDISDQTSIPLPTVKTYLSRVYVKLDVDTFEKLLRWKVLFSEICPVLSQFDLPPAPEPRKLKPAPDRVIKKVEEDEQLLARYGSNLPAILEDIPLPSAKPRRGRWLLFAIGMFLLGALLSFLYTLFLGLRSPAIVTVLSTAQISTPIIWTTTPAPNLPTAAPSILIVTATPDPNAPTTTPKIVTTTPLPVQSPAQTFTPVVIVATATPVPASPTSNPAILFQDSFDLRPKPEWEAVEGSWIVQDGAYTTDILEGWKRALVGDASWKSYAVDVDVLPACNPTRFIIREQSKGFMYIDISDRATLFRLSDGVTTEIGRAFVGFNKKGQPEHVRIEVENDIYRAFVNNVRAFEIQDTSFSEGRAGIGFYIFGNCRAAQFDNFQVERLD